MDRRFIVGAVAGIVAFDTAASIASRMVGFEYGRAAVGSYFLYFLIGVLVARAAPGNPLRVASTTAALAGVADASVGWAISWFIGPGQLPAGHGLSAERWVEVAVLVVALASALGVAGGIVGHYVLPPRRGVIPK